MRSAAAVVGGEPGCRDAALVLPITLAGRVASHALAAETGWRVAAVFRRTAYCRSARGGLVLIGPETVGAGPLHALGREVGEISTRLEVGMRVGVDLDGGGADAGAPLTLDLRAVREWCPPAPPRWSPSELQRGLAWLGAAAAGAPVEGLGRLIVPLAAHAVGAAAPVGGSALAALAWPPFAALSRWVYEAAVSGAASPPPAAVGGLIGLGPGLTPSGDDALAGALLALHAFGRADLARSLAEHLRPLAAGGTGFISRAHLECAGRGEGAAVLHDALVATMSGDVAALDRAGTAVGRLGHTSGWDALAGIVAVGAARFAAAAGVARAPAPCR